MSRKLYTDKNYGIRAGITNETKKPSACRVFRPGPGNNMQEIFQEQLAFEALTKKLAAEALAQTGAA